jgi:hypothetical protein
MAREWLYTSGEAMAPDFRGGGVGIDYCRAAHFELAASDHWGTG